MEQLQDCATRVEVVSGLGVRDLRNESGFGSGDLVPVNSGEEGVLSDFVRAIRPKTPGRVQGHQTLHKVLGPRRNFDVILVPLDVT